MARLGNAMLGLVWPGLARQGKAGHGVRDLRVPDHK
jgi:hypothetical protein